MDREGKIPAAIKIKGKGTINFLDIQVALGNILFPLAAFFVCESPERLPKMVKMQGWKINIF